MKFLCSRSWYAPGEGDPLLGGPLWCFHAWARRQWPWFLLTAGDTLYLLHRGLGVVAWETRVRQVKRCAYTSRRTAHDILLEWTEGRHESGISLLKSAPPEGSLLAFELVPRRRLDLPRPRWLTLPRTGWVREPAVLDKLLAGGRKG